MSLISTQLRNFKEPSKDQLTQIFFSLPSVGSLDGTLKASHEDSEKMEINAVLSLAEQGEEDSYVSGRDGHTLMNCVIEEHMDMSGRETIYHASVHRFLVFGPKIGSIHHPLVHHPESGEAERPCRYIRSESIDMAWLENRSFCLAEMGL
jgi:hypothetical protein